MEQTYQKISDKDQLVEKIIEKVEEIYRTAKQIEKLLKE